MFVVNRTAEVGQDPGNEAKGKGSVTADDGGATEDKTEPYIQSVGSSLSMFFFLLQNCALQYSAMLDKASTPK